MSTESKTPRWITGLYWATTGIVAVSMLFATYSYFTSPKVADGFRVLGFPSYFRVELGVAKALGALALTLPFVPARVKEWAYAGFGITFISAFIAHVNHGDPTPMKVSPLFMLGLLAVSNWAFHHRRAADPSVLSDAGAPRTLSQISSAT